MMSTVLPCSMTPTWSEYKHLCERVHRPREASGAFAQQRTVEVVAESAAQASGGAGNTFRPIVASSKCKTLRQASSSVLVSVSSYSSPSSPTTGWHSLECPICTPEPSPRIKDARARRVVANGGAPSQSATRDGVGMVCRGTLRHAMEAIRPSRTPPPARMTMPHPTSS